MSSYGDSYAATEARILPRPTAPCAGWLDRIAKAQVALNLEAEAGGFHGFVVLTERTLVTPGDGAVWYEIDLLQPAPHEATAWVSWDVDPDPRAPEAATSNAIHGWCEFADLVD